MIAYICIVFALIVAALLVASISLSRENEWKRCPMCKQYHSGNVVVPALPSDSDGFVVPEICKGCRETHEFFERRETELTEPHPICAGTYCVREVINDGDKCEYCESKF